MAQDKSGNKPKESKPTSDIPGSLSDVRGTGRIPSDLPHYRSGLKPPEWREWKHRPLWQLHDACALSMNIDPHSLVFERFDQQWEPETDDEKVKSEFSLRLRVLEANYEADVFKACGHLNCVYASEFANWAVNVVQWENPPELVKMAQKPDGQPAAPDETSPVEANDSKQGAPAVDVEPSIDETLAELFDPVPVAVLEKMFPAAGAWENWAERAARNGLSVAREGRGVFNPYRAAAWFLMRKLPGWDWARCRRTLANNLPARSQDEVRLLLPDEPS